MNPFILLLSILVNVGAFAMYLLFWYVLPAAAIALILFAVGRGLFLLIMWFCRRRSESLSRPS